MYIRGSSLNEYKINDRGSVLLLTKCNPVQPLKLKYVSDHSVSYVLHHLDICNPDSPGKPLVYFNVQSFAKIIQLCHHNNLQLAVQSLRSIKLTILRNFRCS